MWFINNFNEKIMNVSQKISQKANSNKDSFPKDLIEFSEKVEQEKIKQIVKNKKIKDRFFGDNFYASPVIALNHRDLKALAEFFNREDIEDVYIDLCKILTLLIPDFYLHHKNLEYSVQKDPALEFLQEYL